MSNLSSKVTGMDGANVKKTNITNLSIGWDGANNRLVFCVDGTNTYVPISWS